MRQVAQVNVCKDCNRDEDDPDEKGEDGPDEKGWDNKRIPGTPGVVGTICCVKIVELSFGYHWSIAVIIHCYWSIN